MIGRLPLAYIIRVVTWSNVAGLYSARVTHHHMQTVIRAHVQRANAFTFYSAISPVGALGKVAFIAATVCRH